MEFNHEPRAGVEEYLPIIEQFTKQKHAPSLAVAFTMFFLLFPSPFLVPSSYFAAAAHVQKRGGNLG